MPERLKAILDKITAWWKKFNTKQRSVLISIVAVVIVALVILGVVISRPTQVELVEAQSASEASTIKGVLEDNNISYEVDSKLVFFVNKSDEVNAIMALGDNGIPAQAYSIDNVTDGSFSTTEADKQKKYQVYLEDKLKDHLEKQSYVNEASVDITMPDKDGTILKSKEEATAAVTLGLKDSITDDQAYAIARLVATALGNDTTKGITIIDKKANVLYSGGDSDTSAGLATSQLSYKQKLEEQVKNEVKKTLESSNIFSNIEVGMNLDIDFSKTETAQKNYTLPDGQTDTGLLDSESNYQSDATNGQAAVPGTDSNSDDTTYTTQDGTPSESSITDNDKKYLNDEKITTSKNDGGSIKYDSSSITVVATRYKVYDESTLEKNGKLKDTSWEEYKAKHADPVKVTDVDQDLVTSVQNATGISQISFLVYEQPEFVDKASGVRSLSDILQIAITVLIFALLGFVVFKSTRSSEEEPKEEELSVDSLLEQTAENNEPLEDNSKIMAINEYSDTVLDSINKAHNEIMFLYSMLNDKNDELTRLSGDIDKASSRLRSSFEPLSADSAKRAEKPSVAVQKPAEPKSGTMQQDTKPDMKQMTGIDISGIIKTQPASAAPASKAGATATTGTAAAVSVKASDAAFGTPAGSSANADVINHTHEILKLYKSGKSNVEIAKLLSLGTGEVKLIIDLYKEGK